MPFIDLRTTVPTAPQQREALKTARDTHYPL